jgi:hypothetical protein
MDCAATHSDSIFIDSNQVKVFITEKREVMVFLTFLIVLFVLR